MSGPNTLFFGLTSSRLTTGFVIVEGVAKMAKKSDLAKMQGRFCIKRDFVARAGRIGGGLRNE